MIPPHNCTYITEYKQIGASIFLLRRSYSVVQKPHALHFTEKVASRPTLTLKSTTFHQPLSIFYQSLSTSINLYQHVANVLRHGPPALSRPAHASRRATGTQIRRTPPEDPRYATLPAALLQGDAKVEVAMQRVDCSFILPVVEVVHVPVYAGRVVEEINEWEGGGRGARGRRRRMNRGRREG